MNGLYLTEAGLTYLSQLIDQAYQSKEDGKGLSANDFTNELKSKLDAIEAGAQVNKIEVIKINGSPVAIASKAVNIDLSSYAKKTDIAEVIRFKGEVASYSVLPSSPAEGDMYIVQAADAAHEIDAGEAVIWNGSEWVDVGGVFTVDLSDYYTKEEIEASFAAKTHTHAISDVSNLQVTLDGKATPADIEAALKDYSTTTAADSKYALKTHLHEISDVNGLQTALDGKTSPEDITEALTEYVKGSDADSKYATKSHSHGIADITDLQTSLDAKVTSTQVEEILSSSFRPMTNEEIKAAFDARK